MDNHKFCVSALVDSVQIGRVYQSLFQGSFGVLMGLTRLPNDDTKLADWSNFMKHRYNMTVTASSMPPYLDRLDPFVYVMQDPVPNTPGIAQSYIGLRLSSTNLARSVLYEVLKPFTEEDAIGTPVPFYGHQVAVSGFLQFGTLNGLPGMLLFTTIFDADPSSYVIMTATLFDSFIANVTAVSQQAVIVITDHLGRSLEIGNCSLNNTEQILTRSVNLTAHSKWTVQIGQCPGYKTAFVTWRRYVILSICIATTVMALIVCVFVMKFQQKMVAQAVERTRNQEKALAHQLVVGYICHELRNPLHIIKTSFRSLVTAVRDVTNAVTAVHCVTGTSTSMGSSSMTGNSGDSGVDDVDGDNGWLLQGDGDSLTDEELLSVVCDASTALQQMQTTVNEVLDYRAIDSGLSSLKLDRVPFAINQVRKG